MAEHDGDKSQEPTQHRRQQAREEGQVAHSQDLSSAALLLTGLVAILMWGKSLVDFLGRFTQRHLGGEAWLTIDPQTSVAMWNGTMMEVGQYVLPILGLLVVAGVAAHLGQLGFLFLPDKVSPDINRLNVLEAFGRMFSSTSVARLVFGIIKIVLVSSVAAVAVYNQRDTIIGLTAAAVPDVGVYLAQLLVWTSIKIGIALLILGIADYGFQWWKHEQDLKMTTQEIREEMKNLEGDPQIAARRKSVQRQLVMNRLSTSVPKADVVVTNPTELAVAIQYDPENMAAPIVVAKGAGTLAQRIRRLALEHGIPILEKKPLAQALYKQVDVNRPIPSDLYAAVAEVLAYVYQLKGKKMPGAR
jgi:flagellar biosynthetic protein FlhB